MGNVRVLGSDKLGLCTSLLADHRSYIKVLGLR
jgi:hypothetical protein